jgi:hypothetical protein
MKKYPKDGCISIPPLTVKWADWRAHARRPVITEHAAETIMRDMSIWQRRVDTWIKSLNEQQQHDLMQLAMAEIDMLWCIFDTPKNSEFYEDDRLDFRTRFYELMPLVNTAVRLGVKDTARVKLALADLENYATYNREDWLP